MKTRKQEWEDGLQTEKIKAADRDHLSQNFAGVCQWTDRSPEHI